MGDAEDTVNRILKPVVDSLQGMRREMIGVLEKKRQCPNCGTFFEPQGKRVYCSDRCGRSLRQRRYRASLS